MLDFLCYDEMPRAGNFKGGTVSWIMVSQFLSWLVDSVVVLVIFLAVTKCLTKAA